MDRTQQPAASPHEGEKFIMKTKFALLIAVVLALVAAGFAQQQAAPQKQQQEQLQAPAPAGPPPFTEKEVIKMLKKQGPEAVIQEVKQRGVDFDMTQEIAQQLRKKKASDEVITAVANAGPKARAEAAKAAAMGAHGIALPAEQEKAYTAIRNELDPSKQIALAEEFEKTYPDSPALSYVYSFEAAAYQQKGDVNKIVELCQKSLKLKPDNLMSLVLISSMIPQPQYLKDREAEKGQLLEEAENYAQDALKQINEIPRQPGETDEAYQKRKDSFAAGVHSALGMIHLERSTMGLAGADKDELAKAEQEFNTAVSATDRPTPQDYYRLGEAYSIDGKIDDAIGAFKKAAEYGQGTMIKTYADQRVAALEKQKAAK
jgi:tetratricopeptide (TPR) repeat protein